MVRNFVSVHFLFYSVVRVSVRADEHPHSRRFKLLIHPPGQNSSDSEEDDSNTLIRTTALSRGVLALPGAVFYPNVRKSAYVRASFSLLPEDQVEEALKRLRKVLLQVRGESEVGR